MLIATRKLAQLIVCTAVLAVGFWLAPRPAAAYSTAAGYVASDYATGFATSPSGWGPIGVAFDQSDALYVADPVDGDLYRIARGGGVAASATRIGNLGHSPAGLAITRDGSLYVARYATGDVVRIDPAGGSIVATAASGIPCATGLAVDPASGDLFVSQNQCGDTIFRVSNYRNGPGSITAFAHIADVDGLAFSSDGTLYAESAGAIEAISGTSSAIPGVVTRIASVPGADGLAFGVPDPGGRLPFLVANRLDGRVTRVDFGAAQIATSDVFTGGSRGDFAAVDSHGCLYITQTDRIVRLVPSTGACTLQPTTQGTYASVPSQLAMQCTRRRLTLIDVLRHGNHVALLGAADRSLVGRTVDIYFRDGERLVARAKVGADGFFHARAALPPADLRGTNAARYQARLGTEQSLDLKLTRRMIVDSLTSKGGAVTIAGRITPPLSKPLAGVWFERRVSCTKWVDVSMVKPRADGTFKFSVAGPPHLQAAVYRAATLVRGDNHSRRLFKTYTLPRVVALN